MPSVDPKYNKYTLIKNPFAKTKEPEVKDVLPRGNGFTAWPINTEESEPKETE